MIEDILTSVRLLVELPSNLKTTLLRTGQATSPINIRDNMQLALTEAEDNQQPVGMSSTYSSQF